MFLSSQRNTTSSTTPLGLDLSWYSTPTLNPSKCYQHAARSKIRKALWKLTPLSAPMTVMYHIIPNLMMKRNPHINLCTLIRAIDTYSSYEILVHTLTKFRGGKGSV
jgi:hypothetical protein